MFKDKADLLNKLAELIDTAKVHPDKQVQMSAFNLERTLIICAAGLDEELAELTHRIAHRATTINLETDFSGGAEGAGKN
jgi:hypothetical protein